MFYCVLKLLQSIHSNDIWRRVIFYLRESNSNCGQYANSETITK